MALIYQPSKRIFCGWFEPLKSTTYSEYPLFASAMTTISAVVFLYKPASIVAAVAVIDLIDSGFISEGAAMSTLIFASVLAVRLLTLRLMHAEKTL